MEALAALPRQRIPERHALSLTTPGAVRGWEDLHRRYGRLEWKRLFAPAIALARDGFAVAPVAAREWALFDRVLHQDPVRAALYRAGRPPAAGETFSNPELAVTLAAIAAEGADAYYLGKPAQAAETASRHAGGALAAADFAAPPGRFLHPRLHRLPRPDDPRMPAQHARRRHPACAGRTGENSIPPCWRRTIPQP
ncbi:gamma-glutamyltransferase [Cupriavidus basilensis]